MTPRYAISVDGNEKDFSERLVSLTLTDKVDKDSDTLTLTFVDHDGKLALPRLGASITVAIGFESLGLVEKGTYMADSVSCSGTPDQMTIKARAATFIASLDVARDQIVIAALPQAPLNGRSDEARVSGEVNPCGGYHPAMGKRSRECHCSAAISVT